MSHVLEFSRDMLHPRAGLVLVGHRVELSAGFDPALATLSSTLPPHPRQFIMSPVPEGTSPPEKPSTASNPEPDNRR